MDFDLSDEQSMLKDSLDRLLKDSYGFEQRRKYMADPAGFSAEMWNAYAEMGLMALPFAEEDGGLGGTPVETMIVMELLGRALALEPYFATVILGGGALKAAASADQRAELVPQIAEGSLKLAMAHTERNSRYDLHHVETKAVKDGDGWRLTGQKSVVLHGEAADRIIVVARTSGDVRDENGIGLFLVDGAAEGLTRRGYPTQDGSRAAELSLDNVPAEALGDPANGLPALKKTVDGAIAALSAESIGVMSAMHELTVDYLKVRKQFGVPIGAFQVLQHAAVDMYVAIEQARSITHYATMMADSDDADARAQAMHAAKAEIGRGGRVCGENAIQLHGGVGMTMEYAVGHYFKRMTMIDTQFGDGDFHLRALARGQGLFEAA
ncbi:acyl-CoA dehydrogenase family protein [Mesorhizobium sp. YIM 152430]|uniref:acyl-CoA dehydrogenase family protein n=1 Tax=Mesorhizobium sp. YIM 152430 TaxID=3031761 RepID=UPI0023DCBA7A|nr:acyl-CoA dehydrogenase family protein [Mesorhizobium sp. YIM 152430]MDF1601179.1 acyl-CoA dehydrogenase family protein [Mesorhizobium sp. YIM 152430]